MKHNREDVAFLNVIYTLINPNDKWKRHKFYSRFSKVCLNLLNLSKNSTSEDRLHSVICTIMSGIWFLEKPREWVETEESEIFDIGDGIYNPFELPFTEKELEELLASSSDEVSGSHELDLNYLLEKTEDSGAPYSEIGEERTLPKEVKNALPIDVSKSEIEAKKIFYASLFGSMKFVDVESRKVNNDIYKEVARYNYHLIEDLKNCLRVFSHSPSYPEVCLKSGNLDEHALYRLNDPLVDDIFFQEVIRSSTERAAITILMDQSSSMNERERVVIVRNIAIILAEALGESVNIRLRFYGFSSKDLYNYNSVPFDYSLGGIYGSGGTNEGHSIAEVVSKIMDENLKEEGFDEYLFVIGDGQSDIKESQLAFGLALSSGVNIFHFGLDNAYDVSYGNKVYGKGRFAILPTRNLLNAFISIFTQFLIR